MTPPTAAEAALAHAMALAGYADPDPVEQWREPDITEDPAALAAASYGIVPQGELAEADLEQRLRHAFHATRWCKDAARGHAFAHGDDPEDDADRARFMAALAQRPVAQEGT